MTLMEQAATSAERDLDAILVRVRPWAGAKLRYAPVHGGISNVNWRIWVDEAEPGFFLKVPGKGTEMFIDRAAAVDASRTSSSSTRASRSRISSPTGAPARMPTSKTMRCAAPLSTLIAACIRRTGSI